MLRSPSSPSTTTPFAALRLPPPCPVDRVRTVSAPPLELPVKPPPGDLGQDSEGGPKQATSKRDPPSAFRFEAFIGIDSRIWGLITCHTMPLQRIKCLVSRHGGPNCSARTPPVSGPAWCWGSGASKEPQGRVQQAFEPEHAHACQTGGPLTPQQVVKSNDFELSSTLLPSRFGTPSRQCEPR